MFDSQCSQSLLPRFNDRHQAKRKIKDKRPAIALSLYLYDGLHRCTEKKKSSNKGQDPCNTTGIYKKSTLERKKKKGGKSRKSKLLELIDATRRLGSIM